MGYFQHGHVILIPDQCLCSGKKKKKVFIIGVFCNQLEGDIMTANSPLSNKDQVSCISCGISNSPTGY